MRRALSLLPVLSLLAFAPACDADESDPGDAFLRNGTMDINIQLAQADGGEEDGTILWEIVDVEVFDGPAIDGNLSIYVKDNTIVTSEGVETCVINSPYLQPAVREVRVGEEVLFTVWEKYVFEGKVDVRITNFGHMKKLFGDQLLFQFEGNEIYLNESRYGYRLLKADGDVEKSSDGRKLLVSALITGECGASGMPGYTF
ncbi:MAG: hypothetical protein R6X02_25875 [Enhygromyxa sp.]